MFSRVVTALATLAMLLMAAPAQAEKPSRDLVAMPKVPAGSAPIGGEYWARKNADEFQHGQTLKKLNFSGQKR